MFQGLHSQRGNGFSTMITIAIIGHLSKYVHKNEKYLFSSKSLHVASITKMVAHQGVEFFKSHDRSGHSIGINQESHLDLNILALTFPGVYALNVCVDATPNKSYPVFHCLIPHVM